MSLSLPERIRLSNAASADRAFERLAEADAKLGDSIALVTCRCNACRDRRTWMRHQAKAARVTRQREKSFRIALAALVLAGIAFFLLIKR